MPVSAKVIAHSKSDRSGKELITLEVEFHRFILAEINTHRCLSGQNKLIFDLPEGSQGSNYRRYEMSIEEFYDKWNNGFKERVMPSFKKYNLDNIDPKLEYTAKDLSILAGMSSPSNLRKLCRQKDIEVVNPDKKRQEDFVLKGGVFIDHYKQPKMFRQNAKDRLSKMNIRMFDEESKEVKHTNIKDIWQSGVKKVYKVTTKNNKSILVSSTHPILTSEGWKDLEKLEVGDEVITITQKKDEVKDSRRLKKVDGKWVSKWNKEIIKDLSVEQKSLCYHCKEEKKLEVHHIVPVHQDDKKAFDKDNVIGVCSHCHKNVYHKQQGWQDGTILAYDGSPVISIVLQGEEMTYDLSVSSPSQNFVCNDIVVHNCLSRNYQSSRAVPVPKMLEQVKNDPAIPVHFGANQRGMVAEKETDNLVNLGCENYPRRMTGREVWVASAESSALVAEAMHKAGYHKQIVNRIIEPYVWTKGVITGTKEAWEGVFKLRLHKDAQPEFQALAKEIHKAIDASVPNLLTKGQWHLPYVDWSVDTDGRQYFTNEEITTLKEAIKVSTSCCAQVSYRTLNCSLEKALNIYNMLNLPNNGEYKQDPPHFSPCEHQAMVGNSIKDIHIGLNGNFSNSDFCQYRKMLEQNSESFYIKNNSGV